MIQSIEKELEGPIKHGKETAEELLNFTAFARKVIDAAVTDDPKAQQEVERLIRAKDIPEEEQHSSIAEASGEMYKQVIFVDCWIPSLVVICFISRVSIFYFFIVVPGNEAANARHRDFTGCKLSQLGVTIVEVPGPQSDDGGYCEYRGVSHC